MTHGHSHEHAHEHEHHAGMGPRPLIITLSIVAGIMLAELIGGLISNSLALVGDAGHMLVDALALALSLFALFLARRPSTLTRTYGYHRVEIMAALANGTVLVLVAAYIFFEAYQRFQDPAEVEAPLMLAVAVVGLVANFVGIMLLRKGSHTSLNVKGAFWHVISDTISSVGVIVAGLVIAFTGWPYADPVVAMVIGVIILVGALRLVRDSVDILMEAVPKHIKIEEVVDEIQRVPGVDEIHDIHVWTITSGIIALSAHLMIQDQMVSLSTDVRDNVNRMLAERYGITHTTLQLECARCESCPVGVVCQIARPNHETNESANGE
jgi:cobalt-zinc-cadmium efflux system protein